MNSSDDTTSNTREPDHKVEHQLDNRTADLAVSDESSQTAIWQIITDSVLLNFQIIGTPIYLPCNALDLIRDVSTVIEHA